MQKIYFGNTDSDWLQAISICGMLQNTYPLVVVHLNCKKISMSEKHAGVTIEVTGPAEIVEKMMAETKEFNWDKKVM
jgi:hypothetical protein